MPGKNTNNGLLICCLATCFCLFQGAVEAQQTNGAQNQVSMAKLRHWAAGSPERAFRPGLMGTAYFQFERFVPGGLGNHASLPALSFGWNAEELPFFCRIEYRLGKTTAIPFKFRLGSVEYVDWLEQKPGCTAFGP